MILSDLKDTINLSSEKDIYVLLSNFDVMDKNNRFFISSVEESTLIKTNNGWEFEDEVKYILSENFSDDNLDSELKKLKKKGVLKGLFIILKPVVE